MWQRFTERSRRVVFFAQEEATRLRENYVSTEHLLLGLVRESDSVAARLLDQMGISLGRIRLEMERQVARGDGRPDKDIQLSPRGKRVINFAYDEARLLDNNYIGTEHLLLGLMREEEGLAGRVMVKVGASLRRIREETLVLHENGKREKANENPLTQEERTEWLTKAYEQVYGTDEVYVSRETEPTQQTPPKAKTTLPLFERVRYALKVLQKTEPGLFRMSESSDPLADRVTEVIEGRLPPQPGDLGVAVTSAPARVVEVALGIETFDLLEAAYETKDVHGYRELTHGNQALLFVADGTPLKILRPPKRELVQGVPNGIYVRILSGDHEGRAGWIFADAFRHEGEDNAFFPPPDSQDRL